MASAVIALGTNDGRVRVVHTGSGEVRLDVQAHTDEVGCVALSPDGHTLATSGWDRSTKLWEVSNGEEKLKLRSHDGKGLCSCEVNEHGQCSAFDLHCKLFAHAPAVTVMSFSGTGQSLATASVDKNLIVWNVISGAAEHRFLGHTHSIKALAFTRDGALLASGGEDKRILIWDMSSGKLLQALEGAHTGGETPVMPGYKWGGVRSLAFSPDGRRLRCLPCPLPRAPSVEGARTLPPRPGHTCSGAEAVHGAGAGGMSIKSRCGRRRLERMRSTTAPLLRIGRAAQGFPARSRCEHLR